MCGRNWCAEVWVSGSSVPAWLESLSLAAGWFRRLVVAGVGLVILALVVSMAPAPVPAAAGPVEPPAPGGSGPRPWVEPTGAGLVRPDWVSASVTARSSGQRVEVLSERSASGRSWVLASGLVESEFTGPVRFADPAAIRTGGWRDIDTTLRVGADGSVSPVAVPGLLRLSGGGDGERLVSFADRDGRSVSLGSGLPGAVLPEPVLDGSTATYPDVLPGWMCGWRPAGRGLSSCG